MISPTSNKTANRNSIDSYKADSPNGSFRKSIFGKFIKRRSSLQLTSNSDLSNSTVSPKSSVAIKLNSLKDSNGNVGSHHKLNADVMENHYIDNGDDTVYNSEDSDVSTVYSHLERSASMTTSYVDLNTNSYEGSSSEGIDNQFNEWMKGSENSESPWQGFNAETLALPKYLKSARRNKGSPHILKRIFLAQELNTELSDDENVKTDTSSSSSNSVKDESTEDILRKGKDDSPNVSKELFVLQFSKDGKYLAVAGRSNVIKVYKVVSSPLGRMEYNAANEQTSKTKKKLKSEDTPYPFAPVFHQKPVRVFKGHKGGILSIDWSKNNFLISGSMDKTVKLWHVDRPDHLSSFQHEDFVTTVRFHPHDDRFFLSGSLDNHARLWSILEGNISFGRNLGDDMLITASSFTPDGEYCVLGGFNGTLVLLETKGLHIIHRFDIKPKSIVPSSHKTGHKVINIRVFESEDNDDPDDILRRWTYLISTNDSKIRLVNPKKKKLVTRFKGMTNTSSIEASISDDLRYVISGSEDHWCYVWENNNSIINNKIKVAVRDALNEGKSQINELQQKHRKYHDFLHNKLFKKFNVDQILRDDSLDFISNENGSYASFHAHHSSVNAAIFAPNATKKLLELSDDSIFDIVKRARLCSAKQGFGNFVVPTEDQIELTNLGYIIVTTDETGTIRVFREDIAYETRKTVLQILRKTDKDDLKYLDFKLAPTKSRSHKSKLTMCKTNPPNTLSPSNSVFSVPTVPKKEQLKQNSTSTSVPTTSTFKNSRPPLKSVSNAILDAKNGSFKVKANYLILSEEDDPSLTLMKSNQLEFSPSGLITPENEAMTPFPEIGSAVGSQSTPDSSNEKPFSQPKIKIKVDNV